MDRTITQFTPNEIAAMRALLPVPAVPAGTARIIAAIAAAGFVVTNTRADSPLIKVFDHRLNFAAGTVVNFGDADDVVNYYVANHRARVLVFADSLRYIDQFLSTGRATGANVDALEHHQIAILSRLDATFVRTDGVKCLTWLVDPATNVVTPPFLTCIPEQNFHVMYYTLFGEHGCTLKVVVDKFMCEIPFQVAAPPAGATFVMIAQPVVQAGAIYGVQVTICTDPLVDG